MEGRSNYGSAWDRMLQTSYDIIASCNINRYHSSYVQHSALYHIKILSDCAVTSDPPSQVQTVRALSIELSRISPGTGSTKLIPYGACVW